jgi:hypothetical protein
MRPNTEYDPDFASRPCSKTTPARTRWPLLLLAVTATLTLVFTKSTRSGPAPLRSTTPWLKPARVALVQPVPGRTRNLRNSQRGEHFVMMADPSIDPTMVRAAPAGIDEAMVVPAQGRATAVPLVIVPRVDQPEK